MGLPEFDGTSGPVDPAEVAEDRFSHKEALVIAGVSNDTLMTWFKRAQLPAEWFNYSPGRGNRRRYSIYQIILMSTLKVALDAGFPTMNDATLVAYAMSKDILRALCAVGQHRGEKAAHAIRSKVSGFAARVPDRQTPRLLSANQVASIPDSNWNDSREWVTVIDEATVARRVLIRAVAVVLRRKERIKGSAT